MTDRAHPLSHDEFWDIFRKVPRLTVELVIKTDQGLLLTQRDIEPCRGIWHFPGGSVEYGELLAQALTRIARRKLGITPHHPRFLGYIEYPSHFTTGLDSPVGMAFLVTDYEGTIEPKVEASNATWFHRLPTDIHEEQATFLRQHPPPGK